MGWPGWRRRTVRRRNDDVHIIIVGSIVPWVIQAGAVIDAAAALVGSRATRDEDEREREPGDVLLHGQNGKKARPHPNHDWNLSSPRPRPQPRERERDHGLIRS